jgi:hypothetical protein
MVLVLELIAASKNFIGPLIRLLYFVSSVLTSVLHVLLSALRLHCSLRASARRPLLHSTPLHSTPLHSSPLHSTLVLLVGTLIVNRRSLALHRVRPAVTFPSAAAELSHFHQSFSSLSLSSHFSFTCPRLSDNEHVFILRFLVPLLTSHSFYSFFSLFLMKLFRVTVYNLPICSEILLASINTCNSLGV